MEDEHRREPMEQRLRASGRAPQLGAGRKQGQFGGRGGSFASCLADAWCRCGRGAGAAGGLWKGTNQKRQFQSQHCQHLTCSDAVTSTAHTRLQPEPQPGCSAQSIPSCPVVFKQAHFISMAKAAKRLDFKLQVRAVSCSEPLQTAPLLWQLLSIRPAGSVFQGLCSGTLPGRSRCFLAGMFIVEAV